VANSNVFGDNNLEEGICTMVINLLPPVVLTYIQGLKSHDVAMIADSLAEEAKVVLATRTLSKKSFLAYLTALYAAFPDWRYQNDEAELHPDGSISIRWSQEGTHTEAWFLAGAPAVPATRRRLQIPKQFFSYKLAGGKIVEIRPEPIHGGVPEAILDQMGPTEITL
jgi:SnoaL-like polyketide cyclase